MGNHKFSCAYAALVAEVTDTACYSAEGHAASGRYIAEEVSGRQR